MRAGMERIKVNLLINAVVNTKSATFTNTNINTDDDDNFFEGNSLPAVLGLTESINLSTYLLKLMALFLANTIAQSMRKNILHENS